MATAKTTKPQARKGTKSEVRLTISEQAVNVVGTLTDDMIKMLQWAEYSVVRQEGSNGYLSGSHTVPLSSDRTWNGVQSILQNCGAAVIVVAAA
ncbi:hypothetical protein [Leptolyngbya sp. AN10]|uniref:hypothetical protein n=1 Tax=Leptolyngbya sp. AN10 TaxID=3423365 RepID=UPI003D31A327